MHVELSEARGRTFEHQEGTSTSGFKVYGEGKGRGTETARMEDTPVGSRLASSCRVSVGVLLRSVVAPSAAYDTMREVFEQKEQD